MDRTNNTGLIMTLTALLVAVMVGGILSDQMHKQAIAKQFCQPKCQGTSTVELVGGMYTCQCTITHPVAP